jgi:hypothetical protein
VLAVVVGLRIANDALACNRLRSIDNTIDKIGLHLRDRYVQHAGTSALLASQLTNHGCHLLLLAMLAMLAILASNG